MLTSSRSQPSGAAYYLPLIIIALISCLLSFYYQGNQWVSGDQMQMLRKGFKAAIEGVYLPYGNEASTVGNVPGSLSSVLIGLPLSLWFNPYAPVILQELIRLAGFALFINACRLLFRPRTVILAGLLYALNPWFLYDSLVYNPSYLSFGAALVLNMLVRLRREGGAASFWGTFVCSLLLTLGVGWCLQLHFSWPVLPALTGILWLRRSIRFNFGGAGAALILIGLTLIPYFQEAMVNDYITSNPEEYAKERYFGYGLVHVYPLFKAVLYWLRFGSLLVTNKALPSELAAGAPFYQEALYYLWLVFSQGIGGLTVLFAALCNFRLVFKCRRTKDVRTCFMRSLTISCLLALLLAAGAATLTLNYWQIIILFCFALMPVLHILDAAALKNSWLAGLGALLILMNAVSASTSEKFSYKADYAAAFYQFCLTVYNDAGKCRLTDAQAAAIRAVDVTPPKD